MTKIHVYILTNDKYSDDVYNLTDKFDKKYFSIHIITTQNKNYLSTDRSRTRDEYDDIEQSNLNIKHDMLSFRVYKSLYKSNKYYPDSYTIILKDTSICAVDYNDLYPIFKQARKINDWDICYLCKWMDDKDSQEIIKEMDTMDIVKSYSPHGIQALMFSPEGRNRLLGIKPLRNDDYFEFGNLNKILNYHIENENLHAITYSKNIFIYDPSKCRGEQDLIKFNMYRPPKSKYITKPLSIYLYITIVGITALILISFHQLRKSL